MEYQTSRRLTRSSRERMLTGVAGGLSDYFDLDPVVVRLIWVGAAVVTGGLAIPAYLVMWMVMPRDDGTPTIRPFGAASTAAPAGVAPSGETYSTVGDPSAETTVGSAPGDVSSEMPPPVTPPPPPFRDPARREQRQRTAGIILIALGVLFLAGQSGLFWWIQWRYVWPLVLIAIGVGILLRQGAWRR